MSDKIIFLTKESPAVWRVTLNNPPMNIYGPKSIPQMEELLDRGLHKAGDVETRLGYHVGQLGNE